MRRGTLAWIGALLVTTPAASWACGNVMYKAKISYLEWFKDGYLIGCSVLIPLLLVAIVVALVKWRGTSDVSSRRRCMDVVVWALCLVMTATVVTLGTAFMMGFGMLQTLKTFLGAGIGMGLFTALLLRASVIRARAPVWSRRLMVAGLLSALMMSPMFVVSFAFEGFSIRDGSRVGR